MISAKEVGKILDDFGNKKPSDALSPDDLRPYIEHTCLSTDTTEEAILKTSKEAVEAPFYALCIPPSRVRFAKDLIQGSGVKIVTVVSFPMGYSSALIKAAEASYARDCGADEIDMVMNIGSVLEGNYTRIEKEVKAVVAALGEKIPVKVILETALLEREQIVISAFCAALSGASFVKTSTGFSTRGASIEDVSLLKSTADFVELNYGIKIKIKASGGIKDKKFAKALIASGAERIGSSKSMSLI